MRKQTKKWFSLVEVVISAIILSLTVFWIYKLIAENNKVINNSNNYLDANLLLSNITNCIENFGFDSMKASSMNTSTWSFYFDSNSLTWKCMTWNIDSSPIKLNNLDYYLYWKIEEKNDKFLKWILWVKNDSIWKIEKEYTQWK